VNISEILNNLSKRERRHFEFGQKTLDKLLEEVGPIIKAAAKSNIRKPAEVANLLNRRSIRTACGDVWTSLLVKDLLALLYEGVITRAPVVKRSLPASTKRLEANELTKKDIERIKNVAVKLESNKLAAARAARSKRERREMDSTRFKSEPRSLIHSDVKRHVSLLESYSAEALQKRWLNCLKNYLKPESQFPRALLNEMMTAIDEEWRRRKQSTIGLKRDEWPSTEVGLTTTSSLSVNWPEKGILSFVGYRVGKTNPTRPETLRKLILEAVFLREIPPILPRFMMAEWGDPGTKVRLLKIANVLAAFARNAKNKRKLVMSLSIKSWEEDLEHLRQKFWLPHFCYATEMWPSG
jgi:hypothetical protein